MRSAQILISLFLATGSSIFGYELGGPSQQVASSAGSRVEPGAEGALPKDVHPDSRNRLPSIRREDLDERGKKAYDAAVGANNSSGGPQGAAAIRLHKSGVDVRWDSPLGRQLTELAIITTAREHDQQYEWSLH
jgi:hypothetical protein